MGARVGNFEMHGELERGQGYVVYRAMHTVANQPVLLKVLSGAAAASPQVRERFVQEAQQLTRLSHPCVQRVLEVGEAAGQLYVAMQPVAAQRIAALMQQRPDPLPVQVVAQIACKLAGALEHAHANGVVHRDVALGSILLTADATPVLTDFGFTKDVDPSLPGVAQTGRFMGTPGYSAPEQASGQVSRIGPGVDIYGLGAVLYTLLVRQMPIRGNSPMEMMANTMSQAPVPPRQLRPDVPPALEGVVMRCLAKAPEQRFANATQLRMNLEAMLAGGPPPTAMPGPPAIVHMPEKLPGPPPKLQETSDELALSDVTPGGLKLSKPTNRPLDLQRAGGGLDLMPSDDDGPDFAPEGGGSLEFADEPEPEPDYDDDELPAHVAAMVDPRGRIEARYKKKPGPPLPLIIGGGVLLLVVVVGAFVALSSNGDSERPVARDTDDTDDSGDDAGADDPMSDSGSDDPPAEDPPQVPAADPAEVDRLVDQAIARMKDGQHHDALRALDEAIGMSPESAIALHTRGNVYYRLKNYKRALQDYDGAIAIDASSAEPHHNRGAAAERLGKTQVAIEAYEQFLALAPDHPEASSVRADVSRLRGKQ